LGDLRDSLVDHRAQEDYLVATVTFAQADQHSLLKYIQAYVSEAEGRPPRGARTPFQTSYTIPTTLTDNADDDA
jgi:hypothetical protein